MLLFLSRKNAGCKLFSLSATCVFYKYYEINTAILLLNESKLFFLKNELFHSFFYFNDFSNASTTICKALIRAYFLSTDSKIYHGA